MKEQFNFTSLRDIYKYIYVWFKRSFWSFGISLDKVKEGGGGLAERDEKRTSKKKREAIGKKKTEKPSG